MCVWRAQTSKGGGAGEGELRYQNQSAVADYDEAAPGQGRRVSEYQLASQSPSPVAKSAFGSAASNRDAHMVRGPTAPACTALCPQVCPTPHLSPLRARPRPATTKHHPKHRARIRGCSVSVARLLLLVNALLPVSCRSLVSTAFVHFLLLVRGLLPVLCRSSPWTHLASAWASQPGACRR